MVHCKELREKCVKFISRFNDENRSMAIRGACQILECSQASVYNWLGKYRRHESLCPATHRSPRYTELRKNLHFEWLKDHVFSIQSSLYLIEIQTLLFQQFGAYYTKPVISKKLATLGLSRKILQRFPGQQDDEFRAEFRFMLRAEADGGQYNARQLVFVDETHCNQEAYLRKYGWSMIGEPAFIYTTNYNIHGTRAVSGIAALALDGVLSVSIRDIVDQDVFLLALQYDILPLMQPWPEPRSVLILDNASVHNKLGVVCLYLPPYSFDFNPIELVFHLAKAELRRKYPFSNANDTIGPRLETAIYECVTPAIVCNLFEKCYMTVSDDDREWAMRNE